MDRVCLFLNKIILVHRKSNDFHPTIAQLAERETVEAKQLSLGHWFESGWSEIFFHNKFTFGNSNYLWQFTPIQIRSPKKLPTNRIRTSDLEITAKPLQSPALPTEL